VFGPDTKESSEKEDRSGQKAKGEWGVPGIEDWGEDKEMAKKRTDYLKEILCHNPLE
jgi:hypothetical protein